MYIYIYIYIYMRRVFLNGRSTLLLGVNFRDCESSRLSEFVDFLSLYFLQILNYSRVLSFKIGGSDWES